MGDCRENFDFVVNVFEDYVIMIFVGKWYNIMNIGNKLFKVYVIYVLL